MYLELTSEEGSLLSIIIKKAGDLSVSEWLGQEKQILDTFQTGSDEILRTQIEIAYKNLQNKIEEACSLKK